MTVDTTHVRPNMRPNGNSFAEGTLPPPAPPLAPYETTATGHVLLRVETHSPRNWGVRILSSLLSQIIHPKRLDPAES